MLAVMIFAAEAPVRAGLVTKSSEGTVLGSGASWAGGAVPTYSDLAVWTTNSLGAGLTQANPAYWGGISVTGALSDISISDGGWGVIVLGPYGIDMSASPVNLSLAVSLIFGTNQTWTIDSNQWLSVSSSINGQWNNGQWILIKNGPGTLTLAGNEAIFGVTTVNQGRLIISGQIHYDENWQGLPALTINAGGTVEVPSGNAANFLGQCDLQAVYNTINGGILQFDTASGTAEDIYRAFTIGTNGGTIEVLHTNATLTFDYYEDFAQFSIPASVNLNLMGAGNCVMDKTFTGYGGLLFHGSGVWTLNGTNTYYGPTIVSNGTLVVNGTLWHSSIVVSPGATFGGVGFIPGTITLLPGAQAQFTVGAGAPWNGTLTLNSNTVQLALPPLLPPGNYLLATYSAPGSGGAFNAVPVIDSGSLSNGCTAQIQTSRGNVTLVVAPPPAPHLAITSVNGGANATAGLGFSVGVQAQDAGGNPLAVTAATQVILSLASGYGTLGGNLSGTIPVGSNSTVISGVTYTLDEGGVVIAATDQSGRLLPGDSNPFTVNLGPPTTLTLMSDASCRGAPGLPMPNPITVKVTDPGGNTVPGAGVTFALVGAPAGAIGQSLSVSNLPTGLDGQASSTLTLGEKLGSYLVTATLAGNPNPVAIAATATNWTWVQVWSDEFNYDGLPDSNKWSYENGFVRNGENQYYTSNRIQNACVTNGMLHLTARQELYVPPGQFYPASDYTSASLITLGKESWTYGRIEMRAQEPPPMGGVWPAFWMMGTNLPIVGWPTCGELDVVEYTSIDPNDQAKIYWNENGATAGDGTIFYTPALYNGFHIFAAEWYSDRVNLFCDNTNFYTCYLNEAGLGSANPFRHAQYILLDFALGGNFGGTIWNPGLPQTLVVDYVRVYQQPPLWTGSSGDGLWSSSGNWTNSVPPQNGSRVIFVAGTNLDSAVDSICSLAGITFYETAGSNVISSTNGGLLILTGNGLGNYSANEQTLNLPMVLATNQIFNTDPGGLLIGGSISGNGFGLVKAGAGTLALGGSNTYSGATTILAGTLALGPGGSWETSVLNIAAGATLDVSAAGDYTLGSNIGFGASGQGVVVGASAACLQAGSNHLVSLNGSPIYLLSDGADPSLYVSQGVLSLAGNAFTINTTNGSALPPGTYPLMVQATGAIQSAEAFPAVGGSAIGPGQTGFIVVSNNTVNLVIAPTSTLSLSVPIVLPDQTVQLTFSGVNSSLRYRVQANSDLTTTNWVTLFTNVAGTNGVGTIIEAGAPTNAQRFYRVVTP
jgi:autotransporter-associated beta strand protein